jgi:long-chain acyl-CoA synthetase
LPSYKQVDERIQHIGKDLQSMWIAPKSNVEILSINRMEWSLVSLGIYSRAYRMVGLSHSLEDDVVEYIINHVELSMIFVSKDFLKVIKKIEKLKSLRYVVQFDTFEDFGNQHEAVDGKDVAACKEKGIELIGLFELLNKESNSNLQLTPPSGEDLATIVYNSVTYGMPEGVMLSHSCVVAQIGGVIGVASEPGDDYLSFLPLSYVPENCFQAYLWSSGGKIAFYQGDLKKLVQDFCDVQPSLICGVPQVFRRIYKKVFDEINSESCLFRSNFRRAYVAQSEAVRKGKRDEASDVRVFEA